MTPDQRSLAVWGGSLAAVLVVGWGVLSWRGGALEDSASQAKSLHGRYTTLFRPGTTDGKPEAEALSDLERLARAQEESQRRIENVCVPDLPKHYRTTDLISGNAQVVADHDAIIKRGERQKVPLPSSLPLDGGLDKDEAVRTRQLAMLYMYRAAIDRCLEANVTRITAVTLGTDPGTDATGTYAMLPCTLELECTYEASQRLAESFLEAHQGIGLGLRSIEAEQRKDGTQRLKLTVSLLTVNNPAWGLKPMAVPGGGAVPGAAPTAPAAAPRPGGRLGRLGGT